MTLGEAVTLQTKRKEDAVIKEAIAILRSRLRTPGVAMTSPEATEIYLRLILADHPAEVFMALFLDNKNRLIDTQELFKGTVDGASVYPREVVRSCIRHNAAAIIFAHNHPSGVAEPSQADIQITSRLKEALKLIDVSVLDHFIIGGDDTLHVVSLAKRELM